VTSSPLVPLFTVDIIVPLIGQSTKGLS
jgi:hypothetical protein